MDFQLVERNLRESFRALVPGRPKARILELPGVSIASLGVEFQMFNSAFLNRPVDSGDTLMRRIDTARTHFEREGIDWSFWFCEDWLGWLARRRLGAMCARQGLRCAAEMPGMAAIELAPPKRPLPALDLRAVDSDVRLADFRMVGSQCFHVPPNWFSEVFDCAEPARRPGFSSIVAYLDGMPVATAAWVPSHGAVGLYNIATLPSHRGLGIGEAVTRLAVGRALSRTGPMPIVLQSSPLGRDLYQRLGFRTVARISVYNS